MAATAAASGKAEACRPFNAAILRLARILVPVNFTREGRFWHDPAVPIPALPDLAPAQELGHLAADSDRAHFTVAHLTRGQNRLMDALRQAQREVALAMQGCA